MWNLKEKGVSKTYWYFSTFLIIFIFLVFIVITVSNVVDHLKNWNVKIFRWEDCSPILSSPSTMPVMVVRSPLTEVPSSRLKTKDFEPDRPHSEPTWWSYLQPGNPEYSLGWNTSPVCKLISVRSEVGEEQVARTTWSSNGEVKSFNGLSLNTTNFDH